MVLADNEAFTSPTSPFAGPFAELHVEAFWSKTSEPAALSSKDEKVTVSSTVRVVPLKDESARSRVSLRPLAVAGSNISDLPMVACVLL